MSTHVRNNDLSYMIGKNHIKISYHWDISNQSKTLNLEATLPWKVLFTLPWIVLFTLPWRVLFWESWSQVWLLRRDMWRVLPPARLPVRLLQQVRRYMDREWQKLRQYSRGGWEAWAMRCSMLPVSPSFYLRLRSVTAHDDHNIFCNTLKGCSAPPSLRAWAQWQPMIAKISCAVFLQTEPPSLLIYISGQWQPCWFLYLFANCNTLIGCLTSPKAEFINIQFCWGF